MKVLMILGLVGITMIFAACSGSAVTPSPVQPIATQTPTQTSLIPTPTPTDVYNTPVHLDLRVGDRVAITSAGNGLNVYSTSSPEAAKVRPQGIGAGYEGEIVDGPMSSSSSKFRSWKIRWVTKDIGWSTETSEDGTPWIQPLPGKGVFPVVSDVGLSYRIQVYEDVEPIGLAVRDGPGGDQPIKTRKHTGSQGWTVGSPKVIKGEDVIWWKVRWDDGTIGWSTDSDLILGVYIVKLYSVGQEKVTLTLYVHELQWSDPTVVGARIIGRDAKGEPFNMTTNKEGFVMITGSPGSWEFSISAPGFKDNAWTQEIISSTTKHAFFYERVMK